MNKLITPDKFAENVIGIINEHAKDCDDPDEFRANCFAWLENVLGEFPDA